MTDSRSTYLERCLDCLPAGDETARKELLNGACSTNGRLCKGLRGGRFRRLTPMPVPAGGGAPSAPDGHGVPVFFPPSRSRSSLLKSSRERKASKSSAR